MQGHAKVRYIDLADYFDKHPEERFVSDGDPATVTIPAARAPALRSPSTLRVVQRP